MKRELVKSFLVLGFMVAGLSASAQTTSDNGSKLALDSIKSPMTNRFGLSYRMGFNISARFKNLGGYSQLSEFTNPRHTPEGRGYNYDNGYVYDDGQLPADYTFYYGYEAGTTVNSPPGQPGTFDLVRSSASANVASLDNDGDPQHGMELTYGRRLGRAGKKGSWGLEAGLGFMNVTVSDNRTYLGSAMRIRDTFTAPAGNLPGAPYFGRSDVPDPTGAPVVGISPTGTHVDNFAGGSTIAGNREFDAQVFSLRFGPYLELPLNEKWSFSLNAGMALLEVSSDFRFNELVSIDPSVSVVSLPAQSSTASGSHNEVIVAGYLGGSFSYALNEQVSLFAGAQFQFAEDYKHRLAGKEAVLDMGQSIMVSLGFNFSF